MKTVSEYLKSNRLKKASFSHDMILKELEVVAVIWQKLQRGCRVRVTSGQPSKPIMPYIMECVLYCMHLDYVKKAT